MDKAREYAPGRRFALPIVLACSLPLLGCAAQTEQPPAADRPPTEKEDVEKEVVEKEPAEAVAAVPAAPAPAKPVPAKPAPAKPLPADAPAFWTEIAKLEDFHGYQDGLRWRLDAQGIELEDAFIEGHEVSTSVIESVWTTYGATIEKWSAHYDVPVEVILTTICVESKGNPRAKGGRNLGLMQLLPATARSALEDQSLTEDSLFDPDTNIRAGTAYIALQSKSTLYDPPKVAAAYNAGSLRTADNRWRMKQYGPHLDKTVVWFNAVFAFMDSRAEPPLMSYAAYFNSRP